MSQRLVSRLLAIWRGVLGRSVRRVTIVLLLIFISLSAVLRCRTYLLTRRIQAVLAGLAQVRINQTTEGQLLKAVPSLTRYGHDTQYGEGVERLYHVTISNDGEAGGYAGDGMDSGVFLFVLPLRDDQFPRNKWAAMSLPFNVAYVLGWRHLLFRASAIVLDGVVAKTASEIEPDAFFRVASEQFRRCEKCARILAASYPRSAGSRRRR